MRASRSVVVGELAAFFGAEVFQDVVAQAADFIRIVVPGLLGIGEDVVDVVEQGMFSQNHLTVDPSPDDLVGVYVDAVEVLGAFVCLSPKSRY